jgi:hypothetical protein
MTSVLSTIHYVTKITYRFVDKVSNVMKSDFQAEAEAKIAVSDRTTTSREVSE